MILADLGADVVKIERPEVGDDARHFGPFLESGNSAYFASINRGKQSVVLDLKVEGDKQTFLQLVDKADVLVENFRPTTMHGLGLDTELLRERNPQLIYASLSGFGHQGPDTDRPAYDVVVQALSGLMSITGNGPGNAVRVGTSISDILTGMYGAIAISSALHDRERTGSGAVIDLAMLDCTVSAMENALSRFAVTGEVPQPLGTRHPSITPFQAFETRDGSVVVAAGNDVLWLKLCEVLGVPELFDDPQLATNGLRTENQRFLEEMLAPRFRERGEQELLKCLREAGVPSAPIRNVGDVVADEHLQQRDMLHTMRDVDSRTFLAAGSPLRMNGHSPPISDQAPTLGQHTQTVLDAWLERR
jgi:CoA:oxalate CoA-transferase